MYVCYKGISHIKQIGSDRCATKEVERSSREECVLWWSYKGMSNNDWIQKVGVRNWLIGELKDELKRALHYAGRLLAEVPKIESMLDKLKSGIKLDKKSIGDITKEINTLRKKIETSDFKDKQKRLFEEYDEKLKAEKLAAIAAIDKELEIAVRRIHEYENNYKKLLEEMQELKRLKDAFDKKAQEINMKIELLQEQLKEVNDKIRVDVINVTQDFHVGIEKYNVHAFLSPEHSTKLTGCLDKTRKASEEATQQSTEIGDEVYDFLIEAHDIFKAAHQRAVASFTAEKNRSEESRSDNASGSAKGKPKVTAEYLEGLEKHIDRLLEQSRSIKTSMEDRKKLRGELAAKRAELEGIEKELGEQKKGIEKKYDNKTKEQEETLKLDGAIADQNKGGFRPH